MALTSSWFMLMMLTYWAEAYIQQIKTKKRLYSLLKSRICWEHKVQDHVSKAERWTKSQYKDS